MHLPLGAPWETGKGRERLSSDAESGELGEAPQKGGVASEQQRIRGETSRQRKESWPGRCPRETAGFRIITTDKGLRSAPCSPITHEVPISTQDNAPAFRASALSCMKPLPRGTTISKIMNLACFTVIIVPLYPIKIEVP